MPDRTVAERMRRMRARQREAAPREIRMRLHPAESAALDLLTGGEKRKQRDAVGAAIVLAADKER